MVGYTGNGAYCYANSTCMLLNTIGESVSPSRIEVLTGVGLGAVWFEEEQMMFFSNGLPLEGVSRALDLLGFSYTFISMEDEAEFLTKLSGDLENGPVLLGPLDMGYLRYMPNHHYLQGCDHYVLALRIEDGSLRLHDPAGYPYALLPVRDLAQAAAPHRLQYRFYPEKPRYHYWTGPRRLREPAANEINRDALLSFREVYRNADRIAMENGWKTGAEAFQALQRHLLNGGPHPGLEGHLTHFAFPVGARRALNFSEFLQQGSPALSRLKGLQSELFGSCQSHAVLGNWQAVARSIERLGELEQQFKDLLCGE